MIDVLCWVTNGYQILLFAYVILSWVPKPPEPFVPVLRVVRAAVDPVVRPIRALLPPLRMGGVGLDLSIIVVFFGVFLIQALLGCR